jgi:hypothetical protein
MCYVVVSGGRVLIVRLQDIPALTAKGVDILDIGAAILDAPWLEMSYDVVSGGRGSIERKQDDGGR